MKLGGLLKRREALVGLDIGVSGVKLAELDTSSAPPRLINIAQSPLPADVFSNNVITKPEVVSEKISTLLEANSISDRRVVLAMPGPSVFTKKIRIPKLAPEHLAANIQLEIRNYIPHRPEAVRVDYHVIGEAGKNQLDVLVVAVKDEVVDTFIECVSLAGVEVAVVDVDYFAMQNCFELGYPELHDSIVALIDVGARFSGINICKGGQSLFTGDIGLGGKNFTDAIAEGLGVSAEQAEEIKRRKLDASSAHQEAAQALLLKKSEQVAAEFNRQLSLFWNASGVEDGIDRIVLAGGAALVPGLLEALQEKTGIECSLLDAFKGVACGKDLDAAYLKEAGSKMAVCVGLGLRQPGDKVIPDYPL
jgi:type IV pilus assembly protein PilM